MNNDAASWETQRWLIAIEAADTWVDPSERDVKKTGDLEPLAALFRSGAPVPPSVRELLADLLSRHRLRSTTQRIPASRLSESQVDAQVLAEFAAEFRRQKNWPRGPITKAEMDAAVKVLQARAKAAGRGHRKFGGKMAARQLREERLAAFADYYFLDRKKFRHAVSGSYGPIVRMHKKPPAR